MNSVTSVLAKFSGRSAAIPVAALLYSACGRDLSGPWLRCSKASEKRKVWAMLMPLSRGQGRRNISLRSTSRTCSLPESFSCSP